jgi:superfamily II DNA or RNA helicase
MEQTPVKLSRDQIQKYALDTYYAAKNFGRIKGTLCLDMGTGKSKVAINLMRQNGDIKDVLITSPRTNLKENWRKELKKWNFHEDENISNLWWIIYDTKPRSVKITIENVQTTYKWKDKHFDLIVADEIHTMMTPEYSKVFENLTYKYLMGLTGTHDITNSNDKAYYYKKYCPVLYEYYDSADDGLINKTHFYVVNHALTNDDKVLVGRKNNKFLKGEFEHYEYLTEQMKKGQQLMIAQGSDDWFTDAANWFWNKQGTPEQKNAAMRYMNAIKYRKEFLLKLGSSSRIAKKITMGILDGIPNSKVLVFSELTEQIERIIKSTVHSHNREEINQMRINSFNSGTLRALGSCQSLTLGLNLTGATHGIMESYVGSETRSKQKKGRLHRLSTDDVAHMWLIRIMDTQSEKWFNSMTKGFEMENAQYISSKAILEDKYDYATSSLKSDS